MSSAYEYMKANTRIMEGENVIEGSPPYDNQVNWATADPMVENVTHTKCRSTIQLLPQLMFL